MSKKVKMDTQREENVKNVTPSTGTKSLVGKMMNSNNCDNNSPFRLLPIYSTPPSRFLKIRNPFDSPLVDRLHLPICSPGLFAKSTPKREDKFKWSICEISQLKPAEIETTSLEEHTHSMDPSKESQIQEKISSFFNENSVVPSPLSRDDGDGPSHIRNDVCIQVHASPKMPELVENILKSCEITGDEVPTTEDTDNFDKSKCYLPEDEYYKKLFDFDSCTPQSSPPMSTGDSPLQFSPLKELEICSDSSFSEIVDRRELDECALSPITPEQKKSKESMDYTSIRESRSACRLVFSEYMSLDRSADNNVVPEMMEQSSLHQNFFDDTVRMSPVRESDSSNENWDVEFKHVSLSSDYEELKMETSLPRTPKTGLFTSQRKRLSDSFREVVFDNEATSSKNEASEGSSDTGYESTSGTTMPSLTEKTWNNSHLIASTPTKKKY